MTKGRTPPAAPAFTFANGRTVRIRHISHELEREVRRTIPEPKPPLNTVDYGDGRGNVNEPNYSDPDYVEALRQHNLEVGTRMRRLFLLRGTEFEVDQSAVDALRADMKELGVELNADDRYVYLYDVCLGTDEEAGRLFRAIRGESMPTEEAVAETAESFRGDVQGAAD